MRSLPAIVLSAALVVASGCSRPADEAKAPAEAKPSATASASPTSAPGAESVTRDGEFVTRERPFGSAPTPPAREGERAAGGPLGFAASPDGLHWACVDRSPAGDALVTDGVVAARRVGRISKVKYTAAGKLVCQVGETDDVDAIRPNPALPQGAPPASGQAYFLVDGVEGPKFDEIARSDQFASSGEEWRNAHQSGLTFSPDGARVAYAAKRGGKMFVVLDGKESGPYAFAGRLVFSRDGKRFAYCTSEVEGLPQVPNTDGKPLTPVVDGKPYPDLAGPVHSLQFSPDGSSWALATGPAVDTPLEQLKVHVRGAWTAEFPSHGEPFVFSPDGRHIIATPASGGSDVVAIDGKIVLRGASVNPPIRFTSDGKQIIAPAGGRNWATFALDGTPGESGTSERLLSPDGKRVIPARTDLQPSFDFGGGKKLKLSDSVIFAEHRFGPDNRLFLRLDRGDLVKGGNRPQSMFLEDKEVGVFDIFDMASLSFSPDGKHYAFAAQRAGQWFLVVDGRELTPRYDRVGDAPLAFRVPASFGAVALRKGQALLVTADAPKP